MRRKGFRRKRKAIPAGKSMNRVSMVQDDIFDPNRPLSFSDAVAAFDRVLQPWRESRR